MVQSRRRRSQRPTPTDIFGVAPNAGGHETVTPKVPEGTSCISVIHVKDPNSVSLVTTEVGIAASEVISRSGLAPRDGSCAHITHNDSRVRPDTIVEPGSTVHIDNESVIEPVFIDHISSRSGAGVIGAGELPDGAIAHVPGAGAGEFHWVVRHIQHRSKRSADVVHAQCHSFRVDDEPYVVGDIVRAQPSPDGMNALLFDPRTEGWTIHLCVSIPLNMDSDEVRELYRGLLWTIRITELDSASQYSGVMIPTLTFNPRIGRTPSGGR